MGRLEIQAQRRLGRCIIGKSRAPTPPDPKDTSAAQTGTSVATAITNSMLGNVNRVGADGSTLTYGQSGDYRFTDPYTGKTYNLPTFTATEKLSPAAQAAFDANMQAKTNIANIGRDQSARIGSLLGTPVDLSNDAVEGRLMDLGRSRLDPALSRRKEDLRTTLSQQGIKEGSEAFDRAMSRNAESENDAYNQLLLTGRGQAVQEALTTRNQPINEITALLSGSQVSQPNYQVNQPSPIPTTDNAGLINQNYNQRLGIWQQDQAQRQQLMGGLFGLGAGALSGGFF